MVINNRILSIPPYISTSWSHVVSIHVDPQGILVVALKTGLAIGIPQLPQEIMQAIFAAHTDYLEKEQSHSGEFAKEMAPFAIGGNLLEHDPSKASSPDIPEDILNRLSLISQKLGPLSTERALEAQPHCNCPYCQIVKAIQKPTSLELPAEEMVSEEDLHFHDWDIVKTEDNLYTVKSPLDENEQYTVFLGDPVGCTCGSKGCEHIKAVLKT